MLEFKANKELRSRQGWTPIITASSAGHLKMVQLLIEQKVDLNAITEYKTTALYSAASEGHMEVVEALLNGGALTDVPGTSSPIGVARVNGHKQIAELIQKRSK